MSHRKYRSIGYSYDQGNEGGGKLNARWTIKGG